jgi:hypothetical protein
MKDTGFLQVTSIKSSGFCTYGVLECTVVADMISVKMLLLGILAHKDFIIAMKVTFQFINAKKIGCNPEREDEAIPGKGRTVDLEGRP